MYPFPSSLPYLQQQWYAAAWSHEVGSAPLMRTLLDEPVLLYRTEGGEVAALHGVCPHRMLPLSRGQRVGDEIACGYHGFRFDVQGRCTAIPTQAAPPANYRLRTFPVIERGDVVWLWMGPPADATPLPDIASMGMGRAGWVSSGHHRFDMKARWALLVDNLFDLSHIGWVHAKSIPPTDLVFEAPTVEDTPDTFLVQRRQHNVPIDPFNRAMHPDAPARVDLDLYTQLLNPGIINAGTRASTPDGRLLGNLNFIHILTPETAHSTHYFGLVTRDFRLEDNELSEGVGAMGNRVRAEDVETLEAIEPLADRFGDTRRELSAQVDAGALRLRRRLAALLAEEETQAPRAR